MDSIEESKSEEPIKSPVFRIIIGLFIALLIVLYIVPQYGVKLDPNPEGVYNFQYAFPETNQTFQINSADDFSKAMFPMQLRSLATEIITNNCEESKICNAKALYYYVQQNTQYVNDPVNVEYVEHPFEVLSSSVADCESGALLLANLMESVGIDSQLVLIPGHAFLRIWLPDALKKYKQEDDWIYLDWTCKGCSFGELPLNDLNDNKKFVDLK